MCMDRRRQNKGLLPSVQKHKWEVPTASGNVSGRWILSLISGYKLVMLWKRPQERGLRKLRRYPLGDKKTFL